MINPKMKRLADALERDEKLEPNTSRSIVLDMVGRGKRVLEFGCAAGELSRLLTAADNRVTGVASGGAEADEAREVCEEVVAADLDAASLADLLPGRTFDVVVFGNVLERVREPRRVLEETRRLLGPGGYAVLAIPNVTHGSIRLALLRGRFDVPGAGPLDRSYRRFFTLKSIHELCFRAGFRVVEIERTKGSMFASEGSAQKLKSDDFDREIVREIEADPEHDTVQFFVRAAPLADDERLAALVDIAVEAELRLSDARAKLERFETGARDRDVAEPPPHDASEQIAALRARGDVLAEQMQLANERVAEFERRSDALRAEAVVAKMETAAVRTALERAEERLAESREAVGAARDDFESDVTALRESVADLQARVEIARAVAEEATRERDAAFAAREAAEAARRVLEGELNEANHAIGTRAEAIEDLRFALETEATKLRDVVADRDRIRDAKDAQQAAAVAFFAHVEAELTRTRREISHIDSMIRQVQGSKFWLLKRALGKAKRIVVARIRR